MSEKLRKQVIELCYEVMKFPASELQTKVEVMLQDILAKIPAPSPDEPSVEVGLVRDAEQRPDESALKVFDPTTFDANLWANEFCRLNVIADHGTMLAWFSSSIMAGYDHAKRENKSTLTETTECAWRHDAKADAWFTSCQNAWCVPSDHHQFNAVQNYGTRCRFCGKLIKEGK